MFTHPMSQTGFRPASYFEPVRQSAETLSKMISFNLPNKPLTAIFFAIAYFAMAGGCIFGFFAVPRSDHFTLNSVLYRPDDPGYDKALLVMRVLCAGLALAAAGMGVWLTCIARKLAADRA